MNIPQKPFPTYKWRWLSVQPSEGLLVAPVFLGVLRALRAHEGEAFSSEALRVDLRRVQRETASSVTLARRPDRNLFRNSGQYWRGTGLIAPTPGRIDLTPLGQQVASGQITNDEFAALMVRNTVLPNPQTYSAREMAKWREAELRIKPLELILALIAELGASNGVEHAFLTPNELIKVVIPLAGMKTAVAAIAESIALYRTGLLDISGFPNCAPGANDKRLAREFLLFLENFGILQKEDNASLYDARFILETLPSTPLPPDDQVSFLENGERTDDEVSRARESEIPLLIERRRIATSVIQRPGQRRFRQEVLQASENRCVLTQETTSDVVEAAHIIPVGQGGTDDLGNGLCMRVDIHRLFDNGKIRIARDGAVTFNERIAQAVSYQGLPRNIIFPEHVSLGHVEWRDRYL